MAVFLSDASAAPAPGPGPSGGTKRVLVIDDEAPIRELICTVLGSAGYRPVPAETSRSALSHVARDNLSLVVSDIRMPDVSGIELLESVRSVRPSLPVVLVSGFGTYDDLRAALDRGAHGFVPKPFTHAELLTAVEQAIGRATKTEDEVRRRLITPTIATALANAIEIRNMGMQGHCERLATLALRLGCEVGVPERDMEALQLGAILHDVGKVGVPDRILLKADTLTPEEARHMHGHPALGEQILEGLEFPWQVRAIVRHHHERWDGRGYPDALAGEEIPLLARIVAIADAAEAMSARRLYRRPLDAATIAKELLDGRGRQWDPLLVDVLLALVGRGEVVLGEGGLDVFTAAATAQAGATEAGSNRAAGIQPHAPAAE